LTQSHELGGFEQIYERYISPHIHVPGANAELDQQTREQGVDYYKVTLAAARGDKKALKTFLTLNTDGAGAEAHITSVMPVVIHLIGDDAFAKFLREQPKEFRKDLTIGWELGLVYPFETQEYFRQHFPKSAKLLFTQGSNE
jgi:hypothetical protein